MLLILVFQLTTFAPSKICREFKNNDVVVALKKHTADDKAMIQAYKNCKLSSRVREIIYYICILHHFLKSLLTFLSKNTSLIQVLAT